MGDQLKTERVEIRVTKDLLDLIDAARGDVSRTRWIERALEAALDGEGMPVSAIRRVRGRKTPPEVLDAVAPDLSSGKGKASRPVQPASRQAPSIRDTWAR